MTSRPIASIPRVADVAVLRGAEAAPDAPPDLLLEMPHAATRARHFDALAAELRGPFPEALADFFFVNTDVGSGELGRRVAERVVAAAPRRVALVIRCEIPRTFVDCNRVIEATRTQQGHVTPGLAPYVRAPHDRALLQERHAAYADLVRRGIDAVCGGGGRALMLHTYAPRSVSVQVDDDIVRSLHAAYEPDVRDTWPLRPEVDLITADGEGRRLSDPVLVRALHEGFAALDITPAENEAYYLHPATSAAVHAARHPGRTVCMEVRRDLLVREFTPFAEMDVIPEKVDRIAAVLERAIVASTGGAPPDR